MRAHNYVHIHTNILPPHILLLDMTFHHPHPGCTCSLVLTKAYKAVPHRLWLWPLPISLLRTDAKQLWDPSPDPVAHHRQGYRLAIGKAVQGLADRAVPVCATAAKLEGQGELCEGLRGSSVSPPVPFPSSSLPTVAATYPTVPGTSRHLHMKLGLEVLRVVEAGRTEAAGLQEGCDTLGILKRV